MYAVQRSRARSGWSVAGWRWSVVAWGLAAAFLAIAAAAAAGQAPDWVTPQPAEAIRVVEIYDPATGERRYATSGQLTRGEMAAIQAALGRAGLPTGLTGRRDPSTVTVLRRFQRERDLDACGCPSYETVVALGLPTRTVRIQVRTGGAEARASREEEATAAIEIVYGTPPRRAEVEASPEAPRAGEGSAERADPEDPPERAPSSAWFADHGHLLFPIFVGPGTLFPPPPVSPPATPEARGLPFGRRPPDASSGGISTRREPPPGPRSPRR